MWSFAQLIHWLSTYKYLVLFPAVVLEGPFASVIAGYLVSLSLLEGFGAYVVLVVGDLVGDCCYYAIGRWGGAPFCKRWGRYIGVGPKQIHKLEGIFEKHSGKTLIIGKLTLGLGGVVLIAAGAAKVSISEFVGYNFVATIPKSLILLLIGIGYGQSCLLVKKYLDYTAAAMMVGALLLVATYLAMKKLGTRIIANTPEELDDLRK